MYDLPLPDIWYIREDLLPSWITCMLNSASLHSVQVLSLEIQTTGSYQVDPVPVVNHKSNSTYLYYITIDAYRPITLCDLPLIHILFCMRM